MEKVQLDLLFKDLCSRLPYGVKGQVVSNEYRFYSDSHLLFSKGYIFEYDCEELLILEYGNIWAKPILRPMSDLTREELVEVLEEALYQKNWHDMSIDRMMKCCSLGGTDLLPQCVYTVLLKRHYDLNNLIGQELAISVGECDENPYQQNELQNQIVTGKQYSINTLR